jgi:hypothetical protein
VKIWDSVSGQELRTFREHTDVVYNVAFSSDNEFLASGSRNHTIRIRDARPRTEEVVVERESRGLVDFLRGQSISKTAMLDRIRDDRTISDTVRREALALAENHWESVLYHEAINLSDSLFIKLLLRKDVIERIESIGRASYSDIGPDVRRMALALAEKRSEDPDALYEAAWGIVNKPGAEEEEYNKALRWAAAACRLEPQNWRFANAHGIALYRAGKYPEALAALTQSDKIRSSLKGGRKPPDVVFLAMTKFKLGDSKEAKVLLNEMRELMKTAERSTLEEAEAYFEAECFLREAEALISHKP